MPQQSGAQHLHLNRLYRPRIKAHQEKPKPLGRFSFVWGK
jgi:hypothetical protein